MQPAITSLNLNRAAISTWPGGNLRQTAQQGLQAAGATDASNGNTAEAGCLSCTSAVGTVRQPARWLTQVGGQLCSRAGLQILLPCAGSAAQTGRAFRCKLLQSPPPWRPPHLSPTQTAPAGLPAEACRVQTTLWEGQDIIFLPLPYGRVDSASFSGQTWSHCLDWGSVRWPPR